MLNLRESIFGPFPIVRASLGIDMLDGDRPTCRFGSFAEILIKSDALGLLIVTNDLKDLS